MKKGILVTSFGTTYEKTRKLSIESIENKIKERFPEFLVLGAFTSRVILSRLKKRDNYFRYNPTEALEEMKLKKIKDIYVQPLLIIEGKEYDKIKREVNKFLEVNPDFNIKIGKPLLTSDLDYEKAVNGLNLEDYKGAETLVLMGHGSSHYADIAYKKLETIIIKQGYKNVFIGTLDGEKTLEDIIIELKNRKINKVILKPFMLVAGDHAINDMVANDHRSWKSILEENNIQVDPLIEGLGEIEAIQDIFKDHLKDIID